MDYLLDSDSVIDLLNNKGSGVDRINKVINEKLFLSIVSWLEIKYGIDKSPNSAMRQASFDELLRRLKIVIISVDLLIGAKFVETKLKMENIGTPLENFDLLIAATAIVNNLTLVTGNLKHFKRIKGLKIL